MRESEFTLSKSELRDTARPAEPASLSPREREVLAMASTGMTNPQIAGRLALSVHGVKFHLASVYRKLGVTNRTEAAIAYLHLTGEAE